MKEEDSVAYIIGNKIIGPIVAICVSICIMCAIFMYMWNNFVGDLFNTDVLPSQITYAQSLALFISLGFLGKIIRGFSGKDKKD